MRTDKGEAAGDRDMQPGATRGRGPCRDRTEHFSRTFPLRVGVPHIERIGAAAEIFRHVRELRRLPAVDRAGTGEQKSLRSFLLRQRKHAASAFDADIEHHLRIIGSERRARFGRGVNHVRDRAFGKAEVADVPVDEGECRVGDEMRGLGGKP